MRVGRFLAAVTMTLFAGAAWSADEAIEGATPATSGVEERIDLEREVSREINVDLIDLERLREAVEGQQGRERLRLTLQECVQLALQNNRDILVTEFEPQKAEADVFSARGEFDPLFSVTASYIRATQQLSPEYRLFSGVSSTEAYRTMSNTAVSGKLHWGTMYDVTLDVSKEETTWNSFIEEWSGNLTLTVAQPLLRGRRPSVNTARIRIAKQGEEAAEHQLRLAVMTTVAQVVKAYWDLAGATEAVKVSSEALANAERLLAISKKRLEIGTAAAIEVLQAKAGVAVRQSDLISARARVADAEDVLKHLLDMRDDGIFSAKQIIPVDRPAVGNLNIEDLAKSDEALRQSIVLALENRPEIHLALIEIENAKIQLAQAEDGMLPAVDLTGSVSQGGRDRYASELFKDIRLRSDNGYTVGFRASVPIGNRAARGLHERGQLALRQAEQRLEKTKQELMLKVRMAARAVSTSQILVESNRQSRALQETNVVAEEKRLRLGVTTSYRVLEIQKDLTAAQTQELQAQVAYQKALVELRLAEGALLPTLGIEFEPPQVEPPVSYLKSISPQWLSEASEWTREKFGKDGATEKAPPETPSSSGSSDQSP